VETVYQTNLCNREATPRAEQFPRSQKKVNPLLSFLVFKKHTDRFLNVVGLDHDEVTRVGPCKGSFDGLLFVQNDPELFFDSPDPRRTSRRRSGGKFKGRRTVKKVR
jgi:hypothetical protein